jgi:hypothetical protein
MTLLATLRTVVRLVLLTVGAVCLGFGRYDVAVFALSAGAALVLFDPGPEPQSVRRRGVYLGDERSRLDRLADLYVRDEIDLDELDRATGVVLAGGDVDFYGRPRYIGGPYADCLARTRMVPVVDDAGAVVPAVSSIEDREYHPGGIDFAISTPRDPGKPQTL